MSREQITHQNQTQGADQKAEEERPMMEGAAAEPVAGGKVWLVGAGPSDAGLMTLRGKAVLEQADVVVYDKLVGQGIMALIPPETELINVGKEAGRHPVPQEEINHILLREARKGRRVVRLKGGDPFVFGRGGEELELLCEWGIPFEIVPGITSAVAVPAYNGIPVTHRDFCSSFHVITGHTKNKPEAEINYKALVDMGGTCIFLMGITAMEGICQGLLSAGMEPTVAAAVLERGTTAHQRRVVSDIAHLPEAAKAAQIRTPAIIVVGEVCTLADRFSWAEQRPLGGLKIAVTRPRDRSSRLAEQLSLFGAEVVLLPAIQTQPVVENQALSTALAHIGEYDWLVFTSPAGVQIFFAELLQRRMDIRSLAGIQIAAIGQATRQAIEERGLFTDLMPQVYSGETLGRLLADRLLQERRRGKSGRVLLPRARKGTEDVIRPLLSEGFAVTDIALYDTLLQAENPKARWDESVDYTTFTSASTVQGFAAMHPGIDYSAVKAVCIGQQTAKAAAGLGMQVFISKEATMDSMTELLMELSSREAGKMAQAESGEAQQ